MDIRRLVLALDLKDEPDLIARYRAWHAPGHVPLPVLASITRCGILTMEIWLTGNRLIMMMEVAPDFDPAHKAAEDAVDPDVLAWEALMDQFQQPLAWAAPGEKWTPAERIFVLPVST